MANKPYPSGAKLYKDRALSEIGNNDYLRAKARVNLGIDAEPVTGETPSSTKVIKVSFTGAAIHSGAAWQNQTGADIIVEKVILNLTTKSSGASTMDVGYTAVNAATNSDTMFDGIDTGTATAVFDSSNPALDSGANAHAQLVASGKWITLNDPSGDSTGAVVDLYIYYF